ncbi:MAG TPA: protein TolQ [Mariprofundaceae bacterium]|nr:protein TolQ [Mariprofundaceae bacterium]
MTDNLSIWTLVLEAGIVVQLVLLLLLGLSFVSWALIFNKWRTFRAGKAADDAFNDVFWGSDDLDAVKQEAEQMENSAQAQVFLQGYAAFEKIKKEKRGTALNIRHAIDHTWTAQIHRFSAGLSFLATVGSTAPFIGLFGTVWGIIDAFQSIGITQNTSLATVAPGIAEALVATAFGLLAAIPAVIAYNAYTGKMKALNSRLDGFSTEFMNVLTQHAKK